MRLDIVIDNDMDCFLSCTDIGVAAVGTSIKSLSCARSNALNGWIVVSVGSKQVIMTWVLRCVILLLR